MGFGLMHELPTEWSKFVTIKAAYSLESTGVCQGLGEAVGTGDHIPEKLKLGVKALRNN